eukprot:359948-Chlamydomonas_euryale.AAC.4
MPTLNATHLMARRLGATLSATKRAAWSSQTGDCLKRVGGCEFGRDRGERSAQSLQRSAASNDTRAMPRRLEVNMGGNTACLCGGMHVASRHSPHIAASALPGGSSGSLQASPSTARRAACVEGVEGVDAVDGPGGTGRTSGVDGMQGGGVLQKDVGGQMETGGDRWRHAELWVAMHTMR